MSEADGQRRNDSALLGQLKGSAKDINFLEMLYLLYAYNDIAFYGAFIDMVHSL